MWHYAISFINSLVRNLEVVLLFWFFLNLAVSVDFFAPIKSSSKVSSPPGIQGLMHDQEEFVVTLSLDHNTIVSISFHIAFCLS